MFIINEFYCSRGVSALGSVVVLVRLPAVEESCNVRVNVVSVGETGGVGSRLGGRKDRIVGGSMIFGEAGEIGVIN